MRELLRPFGRFHVLALAVLGCFAIALATAQGMWGWIGVVAAVLVSLWAAVTLYQDLQEHP